MKYCEGEDEDQISPRKNSNMFQQKFETEQTRQNRD